MNHEERIMTEWIREMTEEKDKTVQVAVSDFLEAYFTLENMWEEGRLAGTGYVRPFVDLQESVHKMESIYDELAARRLK